MILHVGRSDDRQDQASLHYYAQLFYLPTALNHWQVKFAVTNNIKFDIKVCMCSFDLLQMLNLFYCILLFIHSN